MNADGLISTGQGLLGSNMYAYCLNNPVMNSDPSGYIVFRMMAMTDCHGAGGYRSAPNPAGVAKTRHAQLSYQMQEKIKANEKRAALIAAIDVKPNKTQKEKKQFVDAVYALAKNDESSTGIPAALMTAQACVESGYGISPAAQISHNLFGYIGYSYDSISDSIWHYEYAYMTDPRYTKFHGASLESWTFGVGPAGYNTEDPYYGATLWEVMHIWDLI